jgi:acid phosphatase type 7
MSSKTNPTKCHELGKFTPLPNPPGSITSFSLADVDPQENERITQAGSMSFQAFGCSGNPGDPAHTTAVVDAIVSANSGSFLYHLGDITYTFSDNEPGSSPDESSPDDQYPIWNSEFYAPFKTYTKSIFSIPGNHDGKNSSDVSQSQILNYLANFCADPSDWPKIWAQNTTDTRPAMIQPYPYWRFETPLASIIGLYTNIVNGGMLDDPAIPAVGQDFAKGDQYKWLVSQLQNTATQNQEPEKAVLLALHYPPYSGATNFNVRGDQSQGPSKSSGDAPYLAVALQRAFTESGRRPDAIFSAHAHLYQRLTYSYADGTVMPCFIVGTGGHSLENLFEQCDGSGPSAGQSVPFPAVTPGSFAWPQGESATVESYEDKVNGGSYGFLDVGIKGRTLTCRFIDTSGSMRDQIELDLDSHKYVPAASSAD